jgi:hypothetical protein
MQEECQLGVMEKWPHLKVRRAPKRERAAAKGGDHPTEAALLYEHCACSENDGGQTNHNDEDAIR